MKDRIRQLDWPPEVLARTDAERKKYLIAEALRIGINIDCSLAEAVSSGEDYVTKLADIFYAWPQHVLIALV